MIEIRCQFESVGELLMQIRDLMKTVINDEMPVETTTPTEEPATEEPPKRKRRSRKAKEAEAATETAQTEASTNEAAASDAEQDKEPAKEAASKDVAKDGDKDKAATDGVSEADQLLKLRAALINAKDRTSMDDVLKMLRETFGDECKRADQVPVERRDEAIKLADELGVL